MGCVVARAWRVGENLEASAKRIGDSLDVIARRVGGNLRMTAGLVCSTSNIEAYLQVSPETVWLSPSNLSAEFIVVSNVSWIIE